MLLMLVTLKRWPCWCPVGDELFSYDVNAFFCCSKFEIYWSRKWKRPVGRSRPQSFFAPIRLPSSTPGSVFLFPFSSGARMFFLSKATCWNSKREEEIGRVLGSAGGGGWQITLTLTLPLPFFRPSIYPKGCYFYSPQSYSAIKSNMEVTTIRT